MSRSSRGGRLSIRHRTRCLSDAAPTKLAEYVGSLDPDQLAGVLSNVKGIYRSCREFGGNLKAA